VCLRRGSHPMARRSYRPLPRPGWPASSSSPRRSRERTNATRARTMRPPRPRSTRATSRSTIDRQTYHADTRHDGMLEQAPKQHAQNDAGARAIELISQHAVCHRRRRRRRRETRCKRSPSASSRCSARCCVSARSADAAQRISRVSIADEPVGEYRDPARRRLRKPTRTPPQSRTAAAASTASPLAIANTRVILPRSVDSVIMLLLS